MNNFLIFIGIYLLIGIVFSIWARLCIYKEPQSLGNYIFTTLFWPALLLITIPDIKL